MKPKKCMVILFFFYLIFLPFSHAEENVISGNASRIVYQGEFNGFKFATLSSCEGEWDEAWCIDAIPKPWSPKEIALITKALKDLENRHQLSRFLMAIKKSKYNTFYRYNLAPDNPSRAASTSFSSNVKSIDFYDRLFNHWMKQVAPDEYHKEIIKGTLVHEMTHVIDALNEESQIRKYSDAPQFLELSEWNYNSKEGRWQYGEVSPFIIHKAFSYFSHLVSQRQYQIFKIESNKWNETYKAVSLYSTISRKESLAEMVKAIVLENEKTKKILNPQLIQWIKQQAFLIQP